MKKGQLFIVAAVIVCILLAAIANNYYYTDLRSRAKFNDLDSMNALINNIQNEIGVVVTMDPANSTRIGNFTQWLENETRRMNLDMNILG